MADTTEFNIDDLINEVVGSEDSTPTVRVSDGQASKAKAESGLQALPVKLNQAFSTYRAYYGRLYYVLIPKDHHGNYKQQSTYLANHTRKS